MNNYERNVVNLALSKCRQMFDKVWKRKLDNVIDAWSKSSLRTKHRNKRFVPLILIAYAVVTTSIHVTSIVLASVSTHKLGNLRDEHEILKKQVYNLTEVVSQSNIKNIESMNNHNIRLHNLTTDVNSIKNLLGSLPWEISKLLYDIERSISLLEDIEIAAENDKVDLRSLSLLFNYPELMKYSSRGAKIHSIERLEDNIINFVFSVKNKADNMTIVKNYGIAHWSNLSVEPALVQYTGPTYSLKNNTNNCKIGIEQLGSSFSYEQCLEENFEDSRLNSWEHIPVNQTFDKQSIIRVINQDEYNVIYCLFNDITLDSIKVPCPNYVFKLSIEHSFKVGNFSHKFRRQNETFRPLMKLSNSVSNSEIEIDDAFVENNRMLTEYANIIHSLKTDKQSSSTTKDITVMLFAVVSLILVLVITYEVYERSDVFWIMFRKPAPASAPQYASMKPAVPPRNTEIRG